MRPSMGGQSLERPPEGDLMGREEEVQQSLPRRWRPNANESLHYNPTCMYQTVEHEEVRGEASGSRHDEAPLLAAMLDAELLEKRPRNLVAGNPPVQSKGHSEEKSGV